MMAQHLLEVIRDSLEQWAVAAVLFVLGAIWLRVGYRRIFRVRDQRAVTVVVSASISTSTGSYVRTSTGIGQVRALAEIAHRFANAYWRCRLDQVFTSDAPLHDRVAGDLVVLGGAKTNAVTLELLTELSAQEGFPLAPCTDSAVLWKGKRYESEGDGSALVKDYGYVVRAPNPLADRRKPATAIILAGASTCGGHAAAHELAHARKLRRHPSVAALVECRVRDGFPLNVRVVETVRLRGGVWS